MTRLEQYLLSVLLIVIAATTAISDEPDFADITFASIDDSDLKLDIYLAKEAAENSPLIVWVHGGAWRAGSKKSVPILGLTTMGYSIASVDYRLSPVAPFPAQVFDIKAAIRFLRAHGRRYGVKADTIIVGGASAGGHLAALVGVTNSLAELEGNVGGNLDHSSSVQGIVSFYGASNLTSILAQSTPHGLNVRVPALDLLLDGGPSKNPDLAKLASPVRHVDESDPPLLLIHGDQDPQMPINQSHELHGEYKTAKLQVDFKVVHGGAHGGSIFYTPSQLRLIAAIFTKWF